jgi:hypothetical protein
VDNFTNPTANDSLNLPSHSTQHTNANDAIEAVEAYLLNGGQGLTLVKKQTIGTAVSSITVTDAFSSLYDNYKIIVNGGVGSTNFLFTFALSGITSVYRDALSGVTTAGAGSFGYNNNVNAYSNWSGSGDTADFYTSIELTAPFLAKRKTITNTLMDTSTNNMFTHIGHIYSTTSSTGFTLTTSAGTVTGGTIYVYGYGKGQ